MAWTLKPIGDRVVVKPKGREETTKSGLVLPDTASERPQQGEVLSVGPGRQLDNGQRVTLDVKQGDTVLFAKYSGTEFKLEDEDLLILSERDVLAVIEGSNGTS
jgi:chaperonin GroES